MAAAASGCSMACDMVGSGASVPSAASSGSGSAVSSTALPFSMAGTASGEDGSGAPAEPFSRLTGIGGSDAGGAGSLPGALVGSADATPLHQALYR